MDNDTKSRGIASVIPFLNLSLLGRSAGLVGSYQASRRLGGVEGALVMYAKPYDWVTEEMFFSKLGEIIEKEPAGNILAVPGVYVLLSDHYEDEVLHQLEAERG